jgi:hypothetical protein
MAVSIARKLGVPRLAVSDLRFEVVPVKPARTRSGPRLRDLLKETEKRGRWREAFGIERTEITLFSPDVLCEIIERTFDPYVDCGLKSAW